MRKRAISLKDIAKEVPIGFKCRSCDGSAYNWLMKIWRFQNTGEPCCPDFKYWIERAAALPSNDAGEA